MDFLAFVGISDTKQAADNLLHPAGYPSVVDLLPKGDYTSHCAYLLQCLDAFHRGCRAPIFGTPEIVDDRNWSTLL